MKGFHEQKYPVTIPVWVKFADFDFTDEIKGLNPGHAMYLAQLNWPNAVIHQLPF